LKSGLSSLPQPSYEYALVMPTLPVDKDTPNKNEVEEDAEDKQSRIENERKTKQGEELKKRSSSLQRGLPRPNAVNLTMKQLSFSDFDLKNTDKIGGENEIIDEIINMLRYDDKKYPLIPNKKKTECQN